MPTAAGVAVVTKLNGITNLATKSTVRKQSNNELIHAVTVKVNGNIFMTGVYVSPQTSARSPETTLNRIIDSVGDQLIIFGDLNARK